MKTRLKILEIESWKEIIHDRDRWQNLESNLIAIKKKKEKKR